MVQTRSMALEPDPQPPPQPQLAGPQPPQPNADNGRPTVYTLEHLRVFRTFYAKNRFPKAKTRRTIAKKARLPIKLIMSWFEAERAARGENEPDPNNGGARTNHPFTNQQYGFLWSAFIDNRYLTMEQYEELVQQTKLSKTQIKRWFKNQRAKRHTKTHAAHRRAYKKHHPNDANVGPDEVEMNPKPKIQWKKCPFRYTPTQMKFLLKSYCRNNLIDDREKRRLSEATGLEYRQVSKWFRNWAKPSIYLDVLYTFYKYDPENLFDSGDEEEVDDEEGPVDEGDQGVEEEQVNVEELVDGEEQVDEEDLVNEEVQGDDEDQVDEKEEADEEEQIDEEELVDDEEERNGGGDMHDMVNNGMDVDHLDLFDDEAMQEPVVDFDNDLEENPQYGVLEANDPREPDLEQVEEEEQVGEDEQMDGEELADEEEQDEVEQWENGDEAIQGMANDDMDVYHSDLFNDERMEEPVADVHMPAAEKNPRDHADNQLMREPAGDVGNDIEAVGQHMYDARHQIGDNDQNEQDDKHPRNLQEEQGYGNYYVENFYDYYEDQYGHFPDHDGNEEEEDTDEDLSQSPIVRPNRPVPPHLDEEHWMAYLKQLIAIIKDFYSKNVKKISKKHAKKEIFAKVQHRIDGITFDDFRTDFADAQIYFVREAGKNQLKIIHTIVVSGISYDGLFAHQRQNEFINSGHLQPLMDPDMNPPHRRYLANGVLIRLKEDGKSRIVKMVKGCTLPEKKEIEKRTWEELEKLRKGKEKSFVDEVKHHLAFPEGIDNNEAESFLVYIARLCFTRIQRTTEIELYADFEKEWLNGIVREVDYADCLKHLRDQLPTMDGINDYMRFLIMYHTSTPVTQELDERAKKFNISLKDDRTIRQMEIVVNLTVTFNEAYIEEAQMLEAEEV